MTFVLSQSNYGKSEIRLVKVVRDEGRHELSDVTVDVMLDGDFAAAHDDGRQQRACSPPTRCATRSTCWPPSTTSSQLEAFGRALVEHFVAAGPTVQRAQVRLVEHPWARLGEHEHAFQRGSGGDRVAIVSRRRRTAAASRPASRASRCCARPARAGRASCATS